MEELSKQFVDIVRTHLDSVGIPINNCTLKYNTFECDDQPCTKMQLHIRVGDASDEHDKTEIVIERVDGVDGKDTGIAIVSEMAHDGILMRRVDKRYERLTNPYAHPSETETDDEALERVDAEIKRALPVLVTSTKHKTLDWMVPEPLHKYLIVDLDNIYGDYRKDAHLDNESRIVDTTVDSRKVTNKVGPTQSVYEVRGYKDLGGGTLGRPIAKMTFKTSISDRGSNLEVSCVHIDDDTVSADTHPWGDYGLERYEKGLPVATPDIVLEDFRTMVRQKLEQRRTIADAIELPNEPQL